MNQPHPITVFQEFPSREVMSSDLRCIRDKSSAIEAGQHRVVIDRPDPALLVAIDSGDLGHRHAVGDGVGEGLRGLGIEGSGQSE